MTGSEGDISVPRHLIDAALALMARGDLPSIPFELVRAIYGNNEICQLCAKQIEPSQVQFRVAPKNDETVNFMIFHVQCYLAWEAAAHGE
jgi:hypothetical protein